MGTGIVILKPMISNKIREVARLGCRALLHPGATQDDRLRDPPPWAPQRVLIPSSASTQALCDTIRPGSIQNTAKAGWRHLLEEGERHLSAGRLADAKVCMEHAQFIAESEPAVQRLQAVLAERQRQADLQAPETRYDALLRMARRYEADGHLLEASCALRAASQLRYSAALEQRIEALED